MKNLIAATTLLVLLAGCPILAVAQSTARLILFAGAGADHALIRYGSLQDLAQSESNWGVAVEGGASWWTGETVALRASGAFTWHGRTQVGGCVEPLGATAGCTISSAWRSRADVYAGSVDFMVAPAGPRPGFVLIAGATVARQSGAYVSGDRTAGGVRAGAGYYPFARRTRGPGLELVATRYFTADGGIRWSVTSGLKVGF